MTVSFAVVCVSRSHTNSIIRAILQRRQYCVKNLVGDDKCFEMILTMLRTLNTVANDELECQGHTLECSQMLCEVTQISGTLFLKYREFLNNMLERNIPTFNLLGDDNEDSSKE